MIREVALLRANEPHRPAGAVSYADSVDKILGQIALLSPDPVVYRLTSTSGKKGALRVLRPDVQEIVVAPSVFREFRCVSGCTACCQRFTLDYIPSEFERVPKKGGFSERSIVVNGKRRTIITNDQNGNSVCDFLSVIKPRGGLGCGQWPTSPLSCESAPQLQIQQNKSRPGATYLLKKGFGRGWALTPPAQCEFEDVTDVSRMDLEGMIAVLDRFAVWARYFDIDVKIAEAQRLLADVIRTGRAPSDSVAVWTR